MMQATGPKPVPDREQSVTGVTTVAARAYLINVAETIQNILLPELRGKTRAESRALDCLGTVTRLAAQLDAPQGALLQALEQLAGAPQNADAGAAAMEGTAMEAAEVEAAKLHESIVNGAKAPGRNFEQSQLESYLRSHPLGGDRLRVNQATQLPGGRSKQTILVSQQGARDLPADLVVRQDWAGAVTGTSVYSEFEVLKRVCEAGIRVPRPLILEKSADALGAPFIVVTRMKGKLEGDIFAPPRSERIALQLAEQAGRLHALAAADFAGLPGIGERSFTRDQLRAELAAFRGVIQQLGVPSQTIDVALGWLDDNVSKVDGPRTLVHGDLGFHNLLCDGDDLSALLDWELVHVGSPAWDLGYLKSAVQTMTTWPRFMDAYRRGGGPELSPFLVDFYTLFSSVWLYQLLLKARAGLCAGVVHDMEVTVIVAHSTPRLLLRMSRELRAILGAA